MITEIAQIDVKPGTEKDFEAAVAKARAAFGRAKGVARASNCTLDREAAALSADGASGRRWKTTPWISAARKNFAAWRGLVGQYFAAPPEVEHTETVLTSAG